jgi:hypothetical protein
MDDNEKQEKLLRMMEEEQNQIRNSTVNQKNPEQLQESLPHSTPNLIKCPDCGSEVSKQAKECPNCGSPKKVNGYLYWPFMIILLIIVALLNST